MTKSRKPTRIPNYDYSRDNYYFVTICTHDKQCIFGEPGALSDIGIIAAEELEKISDRYKTVKIDKYVVMPNHVHAIVILDNTISSDRKNLVHVIGLLKSGISRRLHTLMQGAVWQRSFHDHIIRNQQQYEKIWLYIDTNPQRWEKDCFFSE